MTEETKDQEASTVLGGQNERLVMLFSCAGTYEIKTHSGKIYTITVIKRDGALGCFLEMTRTFIPVSEFVDVEILKRYSDDEVNKYKL